MKKAITIGIAALLLGLVFSVPLRVNGLEDEKSVIEREITEPRRASPISKGLGWSVAGFFFCLVVGAIFFMVGLLMALFGFPLSGIIVFPLLGIILILLPLPSLILGIVLFLTIALALPGLILILFSLVPMLFGFVLLFPTGPVLLGIFLLFLALICIFILPVVCLIIGVILAPILFIIGFGEGMANMPYDIGNFIIKLIDAIVPG